MNTHNPYTPPTAPVSDAPLPGPVAEVRKPVSVWLLQIVCALAVLLLLFTVPRNFASWRAAAPGDLARVAQLVAMLLELLVASLFVWTIIAAQRRSQFGRWLGLILLGSTMVIVMVTVEASTPDTQESFARVLGRYTGSAIVLTPPGLLLYFSAFSKRARAWYAK